MSRGQRHDDGLSGGGYCCLFFAIKRRRGYANANILRGYLSSGKSRRYGLQQTTVPSPALRILPTDAMSRAMKTAAALSLISVVALLLADPVGGFLTGAAPAAANKHVLARRNTLCVDTRTPHHHAAASQAPRMAVEGGERKAVTLDTSGGVPRGPAGAIKLT